MWLKLLGWVVVVLVVISAVAWVFVRVIRFGDDDQLGLGDF